MKRKTLRRTFLVFLIFLATFLSACEPLANAPDATQKPDLGTGTQNLQDETAVNTPVIPDSPVEATATTISPTDEPEPEEEALIKLWVEPFLPESFVSSLPQFDGFELVDVEKDADLRLNYTKDGDLSQWVFALVAPIATIQDEVSLERFIAFWQGGQDFPSSSLLMDQTTLSAMTALFGDAQAEVIVLPEVELLPYALESGNVWAIVPFEKLVPRWKVIAVEGQSPLHKDFDVDNYALSVSIGLEHTQNTDIEFDALKQSLQNSVPVINRNSEKLATVVMTGVTAMVRATASEMELKGILYPGEDVREVMREADIAHVSNEIPFYDQCPPPAWVQENLVFCSDPKYIDLLLDIGTDVIDLTGDHFSDYGAEATHQTLDIYQENKLPYFGGGRNTEEATTPVKFEVNGNKIAFLGCNGKEEGYALVSDTNPGAYHCNMALMAEKIEALVADGYQVIFTFQHFEYYHWNIENWLAADFRQIAEAGAVIVSGSQAHQPHAFEFQEDSFIHYGLGNLFFDQYGLFEDTDKAFLDRYVFYDGRLIGIEFLTVQFFDWSKPIWTSQAVREEMLRKLFSVSSWE